MSRIEVSNNAQLLESVYIIHLLYYCVNSPKDTSQKAACTSYNHPSASQMISSSPRNRFNSLKIFWFIIL
jgi:hypothetical protein